MAKTKMEEIEEIEKSLGQQSLFRSEDMSLLHFYIPSEIGHLTIRKLGQLGVVQFNDLNYEVNAFQRTFVEEIRKLQNIYTNIQYLKKQIASEDIPMKELTKVNELPLMSKNDIDELARKIQDARTKLDDMIESRKNLRSQLLLLIEEKYVITESNYFFEEIDSRNVDLEDENKDKVMRNNLNLDNLANEKKLGSSTSNNNNNSVVNSDEKLIGDPDNQEQESGTINKSNLKYIAGVIPRKTMGVFERILWRILRGNLCMNYSEIEEPLQDPETDQKVEKNVFIIFAHGDAMIQKIKRVAELMGANLYNIDVDQEVRRENSLKIFSKIEEIHNVHQATQNSIINDLRSIGNEIETWQAAIAEEIGVYEIMNMCNVEVNNRFMIGEGWCPSQKLREVKNTFKEIAEISKAETEPIFEIVKTNREPPTHQLTNKMTNCFQNIVDAYGIAKYKEVNPGIYTIVTFPFLFAVMFGDSGHGILMALSGFAFIYFEKNLMGKKLNEIIAMAFSGRYVIFLMGLFSIYTGLIYNDFFSKTFLYPLTRFTFEDADSITTTEENMKTVRGKLPDPNYRAIGFGIDPGWIDSENALIFLNSYKMKISIIFGVIHMLFGIILNLCNYIHFKEYYLIVCKFIPEFLMLSSIFGYLCFMIMYKWCYDWYSPNAIGEPPSLLNTLIFLFMSPGEINDKDLLFKGQGTVQLILLIIFIITIPWLLLAKPFVLRSRAKKFEEELEAKEKEESNNTNKNEVIDVVPDVFIPEDKPQKFSMADCIINQGVHTIEFTLNCISNTASYLRLWALSLAHSQLSHVLYNMLFETIAFKLNLGVFLDSIVIFLIFGAWFALTVAIMLIMEGLSAFLHALRLHWVEFNGKFYIGSGYKYYPFSFERIWKSERKKGGTN
ncbi:ATPase V0/A0 complex subunit [Anaeromyces robustus]|uniref:V-type proton ATPase subunit a n=1 Tax=Anaeromyces robustus TaxID=1754192 RepID=A0A1Y1WYU1_9FUNG|nr:ATPase V0/A0 complex subunit [Anaeromyces robustus]|eukprot:ORX78602.1 ATPase V0/A0 complex subunit [Anaeromyces robustus]